MATSVVNKEKPDEKNEAETTKQTKSSLKDWVAIILGAALIILYLVFLFLMRKQTGAEELDWTRSVYLLSGLEAIAFAAAGYFFGSEVNRKAADSAKEDAETAKADAKTAIEGQTDAEKKFVEARTQGLALKQAILAKTQTSRYTTLGTVRAGTRTRGGKTPDVKLADYGSSDLGELANFAESMFKD